MRFPPWKIIVASLPAALSANEKIPREGPPPPTPSAATCLAAPIVVNRFVPPVPSPPKDIPDMRVHAASVRLFPGYRISALLGEPSTLPDIPRPSPKAPPTPEELARQDAFRARHHPPVMLHLGSTGWDRRISRVQWRHLHDSSIAYEAWVGVDVGALAGVGCFFHQGVPHSLFLMHHDIDTRVLHRFGGWARLPDLPVLPPGGYLVTRGDPQDAEGMHPLHSVLALFSAEKDALLAAREKRLEYEREARRWRELHPASKEPVSSTYWLKPHRGSRYLAPDKE